jgi:hypothetical protein
MAKQSKKTSSNLRRFAEAADNGFYGYHHPAGKTHEPVVCSLVLGGDPPREPTLLEAYVARQAKDVYSSCASYEENCERAYRQINDAVKRLRRVRDAFGRTIGKCR